MKECPKCGTKWDYGGSSRWGRRCPQCKAAYQREYRERKRGAILERCKTKRQGLPVEDLRLRFAEFVGVDDQVRDAEERDSLRKLLHRRLPWGEFVESQGAFEGMVVQRWPTGERYAVRRGYLTPQPPFPERERGHELRACGEGVAFLGDSHAGEGRDKTEPQRAQSSQREERGW